MMLHRPLMGLYAGEFCIQSSTCPKGNSLSNPLAMASVSHIHVSNAPVLLHPSLSKVLFSGCRKKAYTTGNRRVLNRRNRDPRESDVASTTLMMKTMQGA